MTTPIHTNQHPGAPFSCSPPLSSSTASFGCRSSTPSTTGASWGSQEYSLPYQDDPNCNQLHLQPLQGYIPQAGPSTGPTYMSYPPSVRYSAAGNVDPASYKQELAKDSENSEMDSDSEPEDSESDDDDSSQKSFHSTSQGSGANASVMKLGKNGKNDKMSLPELKAFLGPKEKLLVKRLKTKLHNTQIKQTKSKPRVGAASIRTI
ncbi:unnamed protein product [Alternaria alternata]